MLIYIHVPFCRKKCDYCAFYSEELQQNVHYEKIALWLDNLLLEIDNCAKNYKAKNEKIEVETIFFGGGTPSLIGAKVIDSIIRKLKSVFSVDKKAEISLEANPDSLDSVEKIKDYMRAGINRISIGVQSFDNDLLKIMGRVHTNEQAIAAFNFAREAKCKNINLDLIWGLPTQDLKSWTKTLNEIITLEPEHLSMYSLTLEEETPFAQKYSYLEDIDDIEELEDEENNRINNRENLQISSDKIFLPTEKESSQMYSKALEILHENGYLQYEISNYSKMGHQCRHNLGYWEGTDYIGFGPSAASTIKNVRIVNPASMNSWIQVVQNPKIIADTEILSLQDRVIELIMLRLRTTKGLRVKAVFELTGRDFLKDNKMLIQALHKNGLVRILHGYLSLTQQGFMVSNAILRHLFENTKKHLALGPDNSLTK